MQVLAIIKTLVLVGAVYLQLAVKVSDYPPHKITQSFEFLVVVISLLVWFVVSSANLKMAQPFCLCELCMFQ